MKKEEIRKLYKSKRLTLSKDEVNFLSEKIFKNFILQFKPSENQRVHIFLSIEKFNEINTKIFIDHFFDKKIRVFVPKMIDNQIISVELTENTNLEVNSWGILEPSSNQDSGFKDFDFVIVPLLYCDEYGNRVGYGKGFYDQFFKTINAEAKKIGVNYFPPIDKIDDVSENDVQLDYLLIPDEMLSFFSGTSIFTK